MLKSKLWGLVLGAALFASCEEQGPSINFDEVAADPSDTTYITPNVPTPQLRNVLLEEFTGVSCPNCPDGHEIVNSIKSSPSGNRLIAIGLYKENMLLTDPVRENGVTLTEDDFRTPDASAIDQAIYAGGAGSLPIGGIDRVKFGTEMLRGRATWVSDVASRMNVTAPVKLEATSTYNDADSTLKVKITATFTSEVSKMVYLTAGIVQDSIIDYQEDGADIIEEYLHNHVFRGFITPNENGVLMGVGPLHEVGRVYVKTLNFKLSDLKIDNPYLNMVHVEPEHCRVFLFLHRKDGESSEVLQALEIHMK